jgi:hypothetical protein
MNSELNPSLLAERFRTAKFRPIKSLGTENFSSAALRAISEDGCVR